MEQTPDQARFERIEAAHETLAKALAAFASDSHTAFAALNISQQHRMEEVQRIIAQLGKRDDDVHALFKLTGQIGDGTKALLTAQVLMVDEMAKLAAGQSKLADAQTRTENVLTTLAEAQAKLTASQAKRDEEHDDLKDKLHVLYDVVDRWIREHGGAGKNGTPSPEPPPAA